MLTFTSHTALLLLLVSISANNPTILRPLLFASAAASPAAPHSYYSNAQDHQPASLSSAVVPPPRITLQQLLDPEAEFNVHQMLRHSQGILRVAVANNHNDDPNDHPDVASIRNTALRSLCDCPTYNARSSFRDALRSHPRDFREATLPDGTVRRTLATATVGFDTTTTNSNSGDGDYSDSESRPLPLPTFLQSSCGSAALDALEELRDGVATVVDAFVDRLDFETTTIQKGGRRGERRSYRQILAMANHLEHFHVYTKRDERGEVNNSGDYNDENDDNYDNGDEQSANDGKDNNSNGNNQNNKYSTITNGGGEKSTQKNTLDYHTDAGFFLAFVPAMNCHSYSIDNSSFYSKKQQQQQHQQQHQQHQQEESESPLEFQENEVVILMGAGAQYWLPPILEVDPADAVNDVVDVDGNGDKKQKQDQHTYPFIAASHALRLLPNTHRAWYGKMHLLPSSWTARDALVVVNNNNNDDDGDGQQHSNNKSPSSPLLSTVKYGHVLPNLQLENYKAHVPSSPVDGCGTTVFNGATSLDQIIPTTTITKTTTTTTTTPRHHRRRLQHVNSPSMCNNQTNFFCWYQCINIPNNEYAIDYLRDGYSLYCLDPAILASTGNSIPDATDPCMGGYTHNSNCMGSWQPSDENVAGYGLPYDDPKEDEDDNDDDDDEEEASGGLVPSHNYHPDTGDQYCYGGTSMYMNGFQWMGSACVIYLFPTWILSTPGKFSMACIGSILFGVVLEFILWKRRSVYALPPGVRRLFLSAMVYGIQLSMGYFIMLVIMTYSGPLFVSTVGGMMLGHVLFNAQDSLAKMWIEKKEPEAGDNCEGNGGVGMVSTGSRNALQVTEREDGLSSNAGSGYQNGGSNGNYYHDEDEVEAGGCCSMMSSPKNETNSDGVVTEKSSLKDHIPEGATPCCQYTL